MAETYWPFDGVDTSETQFSQWARNIGEGVKGSPATTDLLVTAPGSGMTVSLAVGQALVRGHYYFNDSAKTLAITTANASNPRIDLVVLTLDPSLNTIVASVVAGTPGVSPVAPTLTQTDAAVYQIALAQVLVPAAASVITQANVTDIRPFIKAGMDLGNKVINGAFDVWQRGTSISVTTTGTYTADRWLCTFDGTGATRTVSQQAFTPGSNPAPFFGEAPYFLRFAQTVAGSGGSFNTIGQRIEDVRTLAGQAVTVSFWAKASATTTLPNVKLTQNFGSGGSSAVVTTVATSVALQTGWNYYAFTVTVPSISGKTIGAGSFLQLDLLMPINATSQVDVWGVQLEGGLVASPFSRVGGSIESELSACQRYYYRTTSVGAYDGFGQGFAFAANNAFIYMPLPVTMRATPTLDTASAASYRITDGASVNSLSGGSLASQTGGALYPGTSPTLGVIVAATSTNVLTFGRGHILGANNTVGAWIGWSAEL
jgi:hypothetical protein